MIRFCIYSIIISAIFLKSSNAVKCNNGCEVNEDCPAQSHCMATNKNNGCGQCLCDVGYKKKGKECVPVDKKSKDQKGGVSGNTAQTPGFGGGNGGVGSSSTTTTTTTTETTPTTTTTSTTTTSTSTTTTTTTPGTTTQGAPPGPIPVNCPDYACQPKIPASDSDNPFTVRSSVISDSGCKRKLNIAGRTCRMEGGGVCYGTYCLTIEPGNDYCICDLYRIDRQCAVEKPGSCESASGQPPATAYKVQNKRFRNKGSPNHGSIYGRHFASSLTDCVKLCQWSNGGCRSVNFGTLAGQQICEMLSVAVTKGSLTEPWLVDAPGWVYQQVTS